MKIEERLNRLEVNQMHIINMLQQIMERLPTQQSNEIDDPKIPTKDRQMWGEYVQTLREQHHVSQYAIDRATIAVDCEYLATNPKATEDNKNHFKELEETAYEMTGTYLHWKPFAQRSKLQKWFLEFVKKKNVTTPREFLESNGYR